MDIPANKNTVILENIDTEEAYFYYSVYKPEPASIDNYFSASLDVKTAVMMDFQKDKWVIEEVSGEDTENVAMNLIDDDKNTSWRTQASGVFPHWFSVDMGTSKVIDGFYYVKMPQDVNDGPKGLKIEVSQDNIAWTTVLETEVTASYLRQQLALQESVTARYFKVTVTSSIDPGASQVGFAEIDAFNTLNQSGVNGYVPAESVELVNAKAPFTGDGSNLLPPVGAGRMQQVVGWTHNENANISFDITTQVMNPFSAAVWGAPAVNNGKIHQVVTLQPGHYLLKIESGGADGPVEIYGVAAVGEILPDYTAVPTSTETIQYANLLDHQNSTVELLLDITEETPVSIGIVFNLYDRYGSTGIPWTHFTVRGFDLQKVE